MHRAHTSLKGSPCTELGGHKKGKGATDRLKALMGVTLELISPSGAQHVLLTWPEGLFPDTDTPSSSSFLTLLCAYHLLREAVTNQIVKGR